MPFSDSDTFEYSNIASSNFSNLNDDVALIWKVLPLRLKKSNIAYSIFPI